MHGRVRREGFKNREMSVSVRTVAVVVFFLLLLLLVGYRQLCLIRAQGFTPSCVRVCMFAESESAGYRL